MRRSVVAALILLAIVVGGTAGYAGAQLLAETPRTPSASQATSPPVPSAGTSTPAILRSPSGTAAPSATVGGSPNPPPSPAPTPALVPAPLTGLLVNPAVAARHVIAVMVDDQQAARPQSGLSSAAVVWQAPAEGGIPRYMALFQDTILTTVGPVRSSRYYYVAWAAEWRALYVHAGGSPQALALLQQQGRGQLVYNADQFRFGEPYLWRVTNRFAPHNLYTDGPHLRSLAALLGADDAPQAPAWTFAPDAPLAARPAGATIDIGYPANQIHYAYDRGTNTWIRSVTGASPEVDAADRQVVAPKNVVVMRMHFGPLNDGHPAKERLEAQLIGTGPAWVATNGRVLAGTWQKDSLAAPTLFFDATGGPLTLTAGQTFIQVIADGYSFTYAPGRSVGGWSGLPGQPAPD